MATIQSLTKQILDGKFDHAFQKLYSDGEMIAQHRQRYLQALQRFGELFGAEREVSLYSAPGRTEIGGNHTDHNNGVVLAAAVNLDVIAVVSKNNDNVVRVISQGFRKTDCIELNDLRPRENERGHSAALIRGVAHGVVLRGLQIGGFDAYTTSDVLRGSGLSSSAAFEVVIGAIFRGEYNPSAEEALCQEELAKIGQYAENAFFGKPCGLMDQMASAVGSVVMIDFEQADRPVVKKTHLDLDGQGLVLCVSDTKGSHADLTQDYAAIRSEMEAVAACFGKRVLREVDETAFFAGLAGVRVQVGDRATVRAIHFFEESDRARALYCAIEKNDFETFLRLIVEGGHSSFEYNQNAYCIRNPQEQGMTVGLAVSQHILNGRGAWRLQGGGFAGTIQAFVPKERLKLYKSAIDAVFGEGSCRVLKIRNCGAVQVCAELKDC